MNRRDRPPGILKIEVRPQRDSKKSLASGSSAVRRRTIDVGSFRPRGRCGLAGRPRQACRGSAPPRPVFWAHRRGLSRCMMCRPMRNVSLGSMLVAITLGCAATPLGSSVDAGGGHAGASAGTSGGSGGGGGAGGSGAGGGGGLAAACASCKVTGAGVEMSWECLCAMYPGSCARQMPACPPPGATRTVYPSCGLTVDSFQTMLGSIVSVYDSSGALVGEQEATDVPQYGCPSVPSMGSGYRFTAGRFPDATCSGQICSCGDGGATCL